MEIERDEALRRVVRLGVRWRRHPSDETAAELGELIDKLSAPPLTAQVVDVHTDETGEGHAQLGIDAAEVSFHGPSMDPHHDEHPGISITAESTDLPGISYLSVIGGPPDSVIRVVATRRDG